jgi:hypothetical protein
VGIAFLLKISRAAGGIRDPWSSFLTSGNVSDGVLVEANSGVVGVILRVGEIAFFGIDVDGVVVDFSVSSS